MPQEAYVCHLVLFSKDPVHGSKDQIFDLILTNRISKHDLNQVLMSV